jgi:hypothetical protein
VIPNQVRGDVHQPRSNGGTSSELIASLERSDEAILCKVFRNFFVPERREKEPEDPRPMLLDQRIEILDSFRARDIHRCRFMHETSVHPHV